MDFEIEIEAERRERQKILMFIISFAPGPGPAGHHPPGALSVWQLINLPATVQFSDTANLAESSRKFCLESMVH